MTPRNPSGGPSGFLACSSETRQSRVGRLTFSRVAPMRFAHGYPLRRSSGLLAPSSETKQSLVGRLTLSRVAPMRFAHGYPLRRSKVL